MGFTGFYWGLLGFTGFYWVWLSLTGFDWVWLGFTGFYWVLLVIMVFTGFDWVLVFFYQPYRQRWAYCESEGRGCGRWPRCGWWVGGPSVATPAPTGICRPEGRHATFPRGQIKKMGKELGNPQKGENKKRNTEPRVSFNKNKNKNKKLNWRKTSSSRMLLAFTEFSLFFFLIRSFRSSGFFFQEFFLSLGVATRCFTKAAAGEAIFHSASGSIFYFPPISTISSVFFVVVEFLGRGRGNCDKWTAGPPRRGREMARNGTQCLRWIDPDHLTVNGHDLRGLNGSDFFFYKFFHRKKKKCPCPVL